MKLQNTLLLILAIAISCSHAKDSVPRSEIIQFTSGIDILEGVLDLPQKEGKVPLVVFVHCMLIGASQAGWIIPVAASYTNVSLTVCFSGPTVTVSEEIYYSDLAETGAYPIAG